MTFLARFRRQKEDPEIARRTLLLRSGRIGEATILSTDTDAEGNTMLSYSYEIAGVEYETCQHLDKQQLLRTYDYLPGAQVPLRYDPHRPANSFVV
jgi:hypothetical protein